MMHSVISRPIHIVDRIRNDYGIEKDTEEERGKMKKGTAYRAGMAVPFLRPFRKILKCHPAVCASVLPGIPCHSRLQ